MPSLQGIPRRTTPSFGCLATPSSDGLVIKVMNPALIRAQGLMVCQRIDYGMDGLDAIYQLMAEGPYSFDVANAISASAKVAYCKDNLRR